MEHWVSVWGNAVSVAENRPERYAKDITIRYPIRIPFEGSAIRLTFDNYCGTEPVTLHRTTLLCGGTFYNVSFGGQEAVTIGAGEQAVSDALVLPLAREEVVQVSFYLADFTLMRSVVYACGPLSEGLYANGDQTENAHIDIITSRRTQLFYFLSNVSVLTDAENRAVVCYGDSITAQDWPDYLALRCFREGYGKTAIIRRATSGSRILRQYDCLTYESYGLSGTIAGGAETFFGKETGKRIDKILSRATTIIGALFMILSLLAFLLQDGAVAPSSRNFLIG
jgi:protein translocase SecG subunit